MPEQRPNSIAKVVKIVRLGEPNRDAEYWRSQPYETRLAQLEEIRQEYHLWKYKTQPRLQRVFTIIKK